MILFALRPPADAPAAFTVAGEWQVEVTVSVPAAEPGKEPRRLSAKLEVMPLQAVDVTAERHASLPMFNPQAGGWLKGAQLAGVRAQETTTPHLLDPESLVIRAGPEPGSEVLQPGRDYEKPR